MNLPVDRRAEAMERLDKTNTKILVELEKIKQLLLLLSQSSERVRTETHQVKTITRWAGFRRKPRAELDQANPALEPAKDPEL